MAQRVRYVARSFGSKSRGSASQKGGHMTIPKPIKASLGFRRISAGDVVARAKAVCGGIFAAKDDYTAPPVDQATLEAQTEALSESITAALDGGVKAIAEREHKKEVVMKSLRQLGHYAEENCKDDMATFLKSGFQAISNNRTQAQPVSDAIRKIVPGNNSGQMQVSIVARPDAFSYQLRWTPAAAEAAGNWTTQLVCKIKPAVLVTGLTPGTAYIFQVRAATDSGYTDWSESVTRIC